MSSTDVSTSGAGGVTVASVAQARTRVELLALTGLRAVAALGVVISHTGLPLSVPDRIARIGEWGYVGVPLFFMLSGFVLTYNYAELSIAQPGRAVRFYIARVARVMPLYWMMLAYCVVYYAIEDHEQYPITLFLDFFGLQTWGPDLFVAQSHYNGPGWSISVEIFFYALFPFLAPLVARLARRFGVRGMVWMCLALFAALFAVWLVFLAQGWSAQPPTAAASAHRWLYRNPLPHLVDFVVGMGLAHMFLRGVRFTSRSASITQTLIVAGALTAAALLPAGPLWSSASYGLLWVVPFGILVLSLATGTGWLGRLLATRPLVTLGTASYALYITHRWLIGQIGGKHIAGDQGLDPYLAFVATIVILLIIAEGAHRYVELPCRRWILRIGDRLLPPRLRSRAGGVTPPVVPGPRTSETRIPESAPAAAL